MPEAGVEIPSVLDDVDETMPEGGVLDVVGVGRALRKLLKPSFALFLKSLPSCFNSAVESGTFGCEETD